MRKGVFRVGATFGKLKVVHGTMNGKITFQCACGNIVTIPRSKMMGMNPPMSCGCMDGISILSRSKRKINRLEVPKEMTLENPMSEITDRWIREFENEERVAEINSTYNKKYKFPSVPKMYKNNTSGRTGVYHRNKDRRWVARIMFKGKNTYLGSYEKFEDAVRAREEAENLMFSPAVSS